MIGAADLRGLDLFDGLTDVQLADLAAAGDEVCFERDDVLFRGGEHADAWWVLVDGAIDLVRHVGREDVVVRTMDVPGAGRAASGVGRARGLPRDRARRHGRAGAPGPGGRAARPRAGVVPAGDAPDRGPLQHGAQHRVDGASPRVLVTLGTLAAGLAHEINNPAASATRAVDAMEEASTTLLASLGQLARDEITPQQFAALDALRRGLPGRPARTDPMAIADDEEAVGDWLDRHGVDDGWQLAPLLVAGGADVAWCDRVAEALAGPALGTGLTWVASAWVDDVAPGRGQGGDRPDLRPGRRGQVLLADGPGVAPAGRRHRGHREQPGDPRPQARHGCHGGARLRRCSPPVDAFAGELNQVWANVIDNAVDAMDGRAPCASRRGRSRTRWSWRSPTPAPGCRPRWPRGCSRRSTRPRTSARAPASASTSPGASSRSGTAATIGVDSATTGPPSGGPAAAGPGLSADARRPPSPRVAAAVW
nr:cyclic nucleotide-binding domain-containing protein [Nocardioides ungokensis]